MGSTPAKNMKTGSYAHEFEDESKDTPAYLKEFGIGKGTSPLDIVPVNNPSSSDPYADAKKKEPNLDKIIAERNKHKPGSAEYEAEQAKINKAYGKVRNQDLKAAQIKNAGKEETKVEEPDAEETNVTETAADNIAADAEAPKVNKFATGVSKAKGRVVSGITNALNAVYGTGIVDDSGTVVFSDKKKEDPDDETPQERATRLASRDATV